MSEIRSKFYRVSIKAVVLNESRDKFLLTQMENGVWDLPGGGMDWGETYNEALAREILEEMNIEVTKIAERPSYFLGGHKMSPEHKLWLANVVYETELSSLDFTPSDECVDIMFVSQSDVENLEHVPPTVLDLAKQFNPENH